MDPQMVRGAISRARAAEQSSWVAECVIRRPGSGAPVIDPDTGDMTSPATSTIYSGSCSLSLTSGRADQPRRDDTALTEQPQVLKVPANAGPFELGDVAELTKVHDGFEGRVTGRRWRVVAVPERALMVNQRLEVTEVVADG